MTPPGFVLSDEQFHNMKQAWESGVACAVIARYADVDVYFVNKLAHRCKWQRPKDFTYQPANLFWTPERVQQLKPLLLEGKTYTECSKILGCSRNSIAGAVSRHHLTHTTVNQAKGLHPKAKEAFDQRNGKPPEKLVDPFKPRADNKTSCAVADDKSRTKADTKNLFRLELDDCRWPIDIGGSTRYCAREASTSSSYCACHAKASRPEGGKGSAGMLGADHGGRPTLPQTWSKLGKSNGSPRVPARVASVALPEGEGEPEATPAEMVQGERSAA